MKEVRGSDIDLIKWTDSWLKTQGPNTLIVEHDKKTNQLNIRQGFGNEYATKEYREQRVNILLYGDDPEEKMLIQNVHVLAQELTTDILAEQSEAVKESFDFLYANDSDGNVAALVNANCKGYCRALLDQPSIDFFLENLS